MKEFGLLLLIASATFFAFMLLCWLIAALLSPALVTFGLSAVGYKEVSGVILAFIIAKYIIRFLTPSRD